MAAPNLELEIDSNTAERPPRPAVSKRWKPIKWESMYDEWIVRSCLGESNLAIAERYKYTPQHVCHILNTPQAKILRRQLMESLRKNIELKTEERLAHLQDRALFRLTQLLDDDKLMESHPFAMGDRAMAILKGVGVLKAENAGGINAKNVAVFSTEVSALIAEGMKKAQEARLLNSGTIAVDVTPRK